VRNQKFEEVEDELTLNGELELKLTALADENIKMRDGFQVSAKKLSDMEDLVEKLLPYESMASELS
jgi:hypothetical protein